MAKIRFWNLRNCDLRRFWSTVNPLGTPLPDISRKKSIGIPCSRCGTSHAADTLSLTVHVGVSATGRGAALRLRRDAIHHVFPGDNLGRSPGCEGRAAQRSPARHGDSAVPDRHRRGTARLHDPILRRAIQGPVAVHAGGDVFRDLERRHRVLRVDLRRRAGLPYLPQIRAETAEYQRLAARRRGRTDARHRHGGRAHRLLPQRLLLGPSRLRRMPARATFGTPRAVPAAAVARTPTGNLPARRESAPTRDSRAANDDWLFAEATRPIECSRPACGHRRHRDRQCRRSRRITARRPHYRSQREDEFHRARSLRGRRIGSGSRGNYHRKRWQNSRIGRHGRRWQGSDCGLRLAGERDANSCEARETSSHCLRVFARWIMGNYPHVAARQVVDRARRGTQ